LDSTLVYAELEVHPSLFLPEAEMISGSE